MDHTLDKHVQHISELCRICGEKNMSLKRKKGNKKPIPCSKVSSDILLLFGIDTIQEKDDIFSGYICMTCYLQICDIRKNKSVTPINKARKRFEANRNIWCTFDEEKAIDDCSVCFHRIQLSNGCIKKSTAVQNYENSDIDVDASPLTDDVCKDYGLRENSAPIPEMIVTTPDNIFEAVTVPVSTSTPL